MASSWLERPARLKDLDTQREQTPDWFLSNQLVGGVCYVDLFAGDLVGIRKSIPYFKELGLTYLEGKQPWGVPVDIALPCATQNELDADAARTLISNGVKAVAEGANMPTTIDATDLFLEAGVLFAPGKAANAGGVATSGLEMAQNAARLGWKAEKVDARLHHIMLDIHHACVEYGGEASQTNYVRGANIAGFVKVADAMIGQGVI